MSDEKSLQKQESQAIEPERLRAGRSFVPFVDIAEEDDRLVLFADMPGVKPDGLDIRYEQGVLAVNGTVTPRENPDTTHYLLREYGVGDFSRSFRIGDGIDADAITAELSAGVLRLDLPKAAAARPRRIEVNGA